MAQAPNGLDLLDLAAPGTETGITAGTKINAAITAIGTGGSVTIVDDLTTGGATEALSAEQGKTLKGLVDTNTTAVALNTAKVGITPAQATDITDNTNKIDNISTINPFQFGYKLEATTATPKANFLSFDESTFANSGDAGTLYVNKIDNSSSDVSVFLSKPKKGDSFDMHKDSNLSTFITFDVTGPAVENGDVYEIPVKLYEKVGSFTAGEKINIRWNLATAEAIHHETGTSLTPDMRTNNLFIYTLTADGALEKPTSKMGNKGTMVFRQDSIGGHKITLDPAYTLGKNVLGLQGHMLTDINHLEITESPAGVSLVDYIVYDTDKIFLNFIGEV